MDIIKRPFVTLFDQSKELCTETVARRMTGKAIPKDNVEWEKMKKDVIKRDGIHPDLRGPIDNAFTTRSAELVQLIQDHSDVRASLLPV